MLEFYATLVAGCRFWEHFYSLREVKGLQDFSKTLKMSIWNFKTPHHTVSWIWYSGYDCKFPVKGIPVENLWIANFRFLFYGDYVQNQWGHKTLKSYLMTPTLAVQVQVPLVRKEYEFPFQIWYCELCVKKPMKVRQKALFWFLILFFLAFSQLILSWKFELTTIAFLLL